MNTKSQLERLEDRTLLTYIGSLSLSGDIVLEDDDATSSLEISLDAGNYLIHNLAGGFEGARDFDSATPDVQPITADQLRSLTIIGGAGIDTVRIGSLILPQAISITFDGGSGDDVLELESLTLGGVASTVSVQSEEIRLVDADLTTISTTGNQSYQGDLSLLADGRIAAPSTEFTGTISGQSQFSLVIQGNAEIGDASTDAVSDLLSLEITGIADLHTASIVTHAGQTFRGAIRLFADAVLTSSESGDIVFLGRIDSEVDSPRALTVNTAGITQFGDGPGDFIGRNSPLRSLTTDDPTAAATARGGQTIFRINGGTEAMPTVLTELGQQYHDAIRLSFDTVLTSRTNGDIEFHGTVDATAGMSTGLIVLTGGLTQFGSGDAAYVGATSPLRSLQIGNADIRSGLLQFNIVSTDPTVNSIRTTHDQIFYVAVELVADTSLAATQSGLIHFRSTVDSTDRGARSLTVITDGNTIFGIGGPEYVGAKEALQSLTTDGSTHAGGQTQIDIANATQAVPSIRTVGHQHYFDAVVLELDTVLTSNDGGDIAFADTVNSLDGAQNLTTYTTRATRFGDGLGSDRVGGVQPLMTLAVSGGGHTVFNVDSSTSTSPSVLTSGNQSYSGAVQVANETVLTSTGGGDITFSSTIDSATTAQSLTVNTAGVTHFGDGGEDFIGQLQPLRSLTTDRPDADSMQRGGQTIFNISEPAGGGWTVSTVESQNHYDPVELHANTWLQSTGDGIIAFYNTVDSAALAAYDLTILSTGQVVFGDGTADYIGQASPLKNLVIDGGATTQLNIADSDLTTSSITTTNGQTFTGPVVLAADTVLKSLVSGNIEFLSTIDSLDATPRALELTGKSEIRFGDGGQDTIGTTFPLRTIATDDAVTTIIDVEGGLNAAVTITTTGNQEWQTPLVLAKSAVLTSQLAGNIQFHDTVDARVDGAASLAVNTAGDTHFLAFVGAKHPLDNLTTDTFGRTFLKIADASIAAPTIQTTGSQSFGDAVILEEDAFLEGKGTTSQITFGGRIDSDSVEYHSLTLTAGTLGTIEFKGRIGETFALGSTSGGALVLRQASDVVFRETVQTVRLSGPLQVLYASMNVTGEVSATGGLVSVSGIRSEQNVVEISVGGTPGDSLEFNTLRVTSEATVTKGHGIQIASADAITELTDISVSGVIVEEIVESGIVAEHTSSIIVSTSIVRDNRQSGIKFTRVTNSAIREVVVEENGITGENGDRDGIHIVASSGIEMDQLTVTRNYFNGVYLVDVANSSVVNSRIDENGRNVGGVLTAAGIRVVEGPDDIETAGNVFLYNRIYDNGPTNRGVGIDLVGGDTELLTGMTLNDKDFERPYESDSDDGPNRLLNTPEINYIYLENNELVIRYSVPTFDPTEYAGGGLRIQFYVANDLYNSANTYDDWRQGRIFLGEATYQNGPSGAVNVAGGLQIARIPLSQLPSVVPAQYRVPEKILKDNPLRLVATATGASGTSEFSRAAAVNGRPGETGLPQANAPDELGRLGFLYAPGPKMPVLGEVPAFQMHWTTDGDNDQDIANTNPATYFNNELGLYSIDKSSIDKSPGTVNDVEPASFPGGIAASSAYVTAVEAEALNWDNTNVDLGDDDPRDDISNAELSISGLIRTPIVGYLTETVSGAQTELKLRYISLYDTATFKTYLDNRIQSAGEGYGDSVILLGQEEVRLRSVKSVNKAETTFHPRTGLHYFQYDVTVIVERKFNGTDKLPLEHVGKKPIPLDQRTDRNPFGIPLIGYALLVRGSSDVSVVDKDHTNQNQFAFYLVQNGTYKEVLNTNAGNEAVDPANERPGAHPDRAQVFYSISAANSDAKVHMRGEWLGGFLKLYWSDAFDLGTFGKPVGTPDNQSPRGIKAAVVTVVDPFVQPLVGPGSRSALADAKSAVSPGGTRPGDPPPTVEAVGLSVGSSAWVNGVGVATGSLSRTDASTAATITLRHSGNTTIRVNGETFGPGENAVIILQAGQRSIDFTVENLRRKEKVTLTASADGLRSRSQKVTGPKGRPKKNPRRAGRAVTAAAVVVTMEATSKATSGGGLELPAE